MTDTPTRADLLPCPFCGSEAFAAVTLDKTFRPMCKRDGCCALDAATTAAEACVAWNTRDTTAHEGRTIYVQFSDIDTIRKWAWEPFDIAEPLIAESGVVPDIRTNFCTGCKTLADDLETMTHARNDALAEVETMEVHLSIHRLEIERLRDAAKQALSALETASRILTAEHCALVGKKKWAEDDMARLRAALEGTSRG